MVLASYLDRSGVKARLCRGSPGAAGRTRPMTRPLWSMGPAFHFCLHVDLLYVLIVKDVVATKDRRTKGTESKSPTIISLFKKF